MLINIEGEYYVNEAKAVLFFLLLGKLNSSHRKSLHQHSLPQCLETHTVGTTFPQSSGSVYNLEVEKAAKTTMWPEPTFTLCLSQPATECMGVGLIFSWIDLRGVLHD